MIAETRRATCASQGREVIYDAEHFFDGWKPNPEYAAEDDSRRGRGRGASSSSSATPTAARCPRRSPS